MKRHQPNKWYSRLQYLLVAISMITASTFLIKADRLWAEVKIGSEAPPLKVDEAVSKLSMTISNIAEKISPMVVSVNSEIVIGQRYQNPFRGSPFGQDFFEFFNDPRRTPRGQQPETREYKQQGMGSGVIISEEGYVLTNNHVVGEADSIFVTLTDQRKFEAEIVGSDKMSDLALIKLKDPPNNLPVVRLGDSETLKVGELVIAIGSPFGYSNTITQGIVSAKGRTTGLNLYENYIQTDASINPGNSGGALLNLKGELVGINTAIASRSGGSQGIGFAIPINMAKVIVDDLINGGSVKRGFLGVMPQDLDKNLAEHFGLEEISGTLISQVVEDSPAAKGGFQQEDVVLKVEGKKVNNANHFRNLVALLRPGTSVKFDVMRDREPKTLNVIIGTRDDAVPSGFRENEQAKKPLLGLKIENIGEEHIRTYGLQVEGGVVITHVKINTEADRAGLRSGDVILRIGKVDIKNLSDVQRAVKKSQNKVLIYIDRNGQPLFKSLKLE
jgi:serine protease Do